MAFKKFGKYIFPIIATAFSFDALFPKFSPLQMIPILQDEVQCSDYVVEETVRLYLDEGIRARNAQANVWMQAAVEHGTTGIDRSNPLWDWAARYLEGVGKMAENTTREGSRFISFASYQSDEIFNKGGVKKCRVIANTVSNNLAGEGNYTTNNIIVTIRDGQVMIE